MRCTPVVLAFALAACTANLPDIDATISERARAADYPTLQPLPDLITRSEAGSSVVVETASLNARVARLKARARALKGRTIIDGATRLKLINAAAGKTL